MLSIVLIGTGNVATHLFNAFSASGKVKVAQIAGRNPDRLKQLANSTSTSTNLNDLAIADIYIIAVNDDAINSVYQSLTLNNKLVVHTSGSQALYPLKNNRSGVFYPLQTFSKQRNLTSSDIPICIEAENPDDLAKLEELALAISQSVQSVSSDQRKALHLAAVFVNNFTNHLFSIANEICQEHQLPFELLQPLMQETLNKLDHLSPTDAQTGPARRNDKGTIEKHSALLNKKSQQEIYTLLSDSIAKKYGKKL